MVKTAPAFSEGHFVTLDDNRVVFIGGPDQGAGQAGASVVQSRFEVTPEGVVKHFEDEVRNKPEGEEEEEEATPEMAILKEVLQNGDDTGIEIDGKPIFAAWLDEYAVTETRYQAQEIEEAVIAHLSKTWEDSERQRLAGAAAEMISDTEVGWAEVLSLFDKDGNIYALAAIRQDNENDDYTYLEFLGSRQSGGLGKRAMQYIAELSVERDFGLRWQSLQSATGFYDKIGFANYPDPSYDSFDPHYKVPYDALAEWLENMRDKKALEDDEPENGIFAVSERLLKKAGLEHLLPKKPKGEKRFVTLEDGRTIFI